jgi:hypothetical protein
MLVVLSHSQEHAADMTLKNGFMYLKADSSVGKIRDKLKFGEKDWDATVRFSPEMVKRALPLSTTMAVVEDRCLYFSRDNFEHIISLIGDD